MDDIQHVDTIYGYCIEQIVNSQTFSYIKPEDLIKNEWERAMAAMGERESKKFFSTYFHTLLPCSITLCLFVCLTFWFNIAEV
jgi:hypothetical protein